MEAPALSGDIALYLYGFVVPPVDVEGLVGVDGQARVELVAEGPLACVVSRVAARDFAVPGGAASAAHQLEWVTPRAWRHHDVVRRLHEVTTVLPLKFGTLCGDEDAVHGLLVRRRDPVLTLLDGFRDKDEWTLTVSVDAGIVSTTCQAEDAELAALVEEERQLPAGRAFFLRKRMSARTADLVAARRAATAGAVYARLAGLGIGVAPSAGDTAALLVARDRFALLATALAELEADHATARLSLELRGPWAPYSFVTALD